jgi:nicotinamide riboside kinase
METAPRNPRNIFICGAQCSGKTTLVNALEQYLKANDKANDKANGKPTPRKPLSIIREVARNVLITHKYTAQDIRNSPTRALQLQKLILAAQYKAEVMQKDKFFISDRSGLDPVIYAKVYVGESAAQEMMESDIWKEIETRLRSSLVIVCEPGAPWLFNDGVRLMPTDNSEWMALHIEFCEMLSRFGIEFKVVPKEMTDLGERVKFVMEALCN